jgi:hypothetical protein
MAADAIEPRVARLAKNEALFRAVNDQVEKLSQHASGSELTRYVCECPDLGCGSHVELSRREYIGLRENRTHFVVLPDHVFPELETIVDDRGHYVIVEKFGVAGEVAAALGARDADSYRR